MAGRFSTTVSPKQAQSVYQNTSTSVQVASINLVSSDSSKNPKISMKLDTGAPNLYSMNSIVPSGTPLTSTGAAIIDIGTVGSSLLIADVLARNKGTSTIRGSYDTGTNPDYPRWKTCTCIDPYMWIDPADYFSYSDATVPFIDWDSTTGVQFWVDAKSMWEGFKERWASSSNDTSRDLLLSHSYANYDHPSVFDFYSGTWVGMKSNNYMFTSKVYYNGATLTRDNSTITSSSVLYNLFSSTNQSSNYNNNAMLPRETLMQSDRGVFVFTKGSTVDNSSYFWICQMKDNTTDQIPVTTSFFEPLSGAYQWQNALITSNTTYNRNFTGGKPEWIKYNPATLKYYFYFRYCSGTGNDGIWSATSESLDASPNNNTFYNSTNTFTYEGPIPVEDMYQPSRVAKSLWVSTNMSGGVYYSTDLVTWKTAKDYFNSIFSYIDNSSEIYEGYYPYNSVNYFKNTETGAINLFTSNFDSIPNAGSLENQTSVGTFERTGVLLNPGDYIYLENQDDSVTISSTVMYVEV